jgi:hypothetical protein
MTDDVEIAIFAKAPIANFAKSRLIPRLGAQGAADLQDRFIRRTVQTVLKSGIRPVSLWCAPEQSHPLFVSLGQMYGLTLYDQAGGDLGRRMLTAFETLSPRRSLLLVGTDCPILTPDHLVLCASALGHGADGVFLPTEDGGTPWLDCEDRSRRSSAIFLGVPTGS